MHAKFHFHNLLNDETPHEKWVASPFLLLPFCSSEQLHPRNQSSKYSSLPNLTNTGSYKDEVICPFHLSIKSLPQKLILHKTLLYSYLCFVFFATQIICWWWMFLHLKSHSPMSEMYTHLVLSLPIIFFTCFLFAPLIDNVVNRESGERVPP